MPISINDGKTTPVAHVFTQDAQQNGADPAEFVNRANANGPSFWERITSVLTLGKPKTAGRNMVKERLHLPIAGTIDGNPAVLGSIDVYVTILADQNVSSQANVKDAVVMTANYLNAAAIRDQIASFAPRVG